jgi:hypothetical protein
MSQPDKQPGNAGVIFFCLGFGLLAVAAVPGVGWMWGQFYETLALCVGIVPLTYAVVICFVNLTNRVTALEQRIVAADGARKI